MNGAVADAQLLPDAAHAPALSVELQRLADVEALPRTAAVNPRRLERAAGRSGCVPGSASARTRQSRQECEHHLPDARGGVNAFAVADEVDPEIPELLKRNPEGGWYYGRSGRTSGPGRLRSAAAEPASSSRRAASGSSSPPIRLCPRTGRRPPAHDPGSSAGGRASGFPRSGRPWIRRCRSHISASKPDPFHRRGHWNFRPPAAQEYPSRDLSFRWFRPSICSSPPQARARKYAELGHLHSVKRLTMERVRGIYSIRHRPHFSTRTLGQNT